MLGPGGVTVVPGSALRLGEDDEGAGGGTLELDALALALVLVLGDVDDEGGKLGSGSMAPSPGKTRTGPGRALAARFSLDGREGAGTATGGGEAGCNVLVTVVNTVDVSATITVVLMVGAASSWRRRTSARGSHGAGMAWAKSGKRRGRPVISR